MIPLSYGQQRLWLLDRIQESGAAYNTVLTVHLHGPLNTGALKEAVDDLLERHAALRTVFPQVGGTPHQHVVPADEIRGRDVLIRSDVSGSQEERERCGHHSFDLAEELPIHPVLFEVAPHHHVLLLVMHHIAVDGWSLRPLLGDLAAAYGARLLGKAPDWSPLPVQYTDYTLWQRELLGMEQDPDSLRSVQARFWRDELQGLPDAVHLPLDRPRPKTASYRGGAVPLSLSSDVHALLLTLAREERATLFMTLHAGLVALFFRLGAGTDIPLGTPVAGRTDEALDDLVGFFINTLVLRTNVSGDPGFRELLARVRVADLDAFSHQDLPFDQVVETVNPRRSLAHHSLFQTMLVLQNNRPPAPHFPGLETEIDISDLDPAKFDLTFDLWDSYEDDGTPAGVHGTLKYARDLWDAPSAEALGERFVRLLETVARQPETPVSRVDLLSSSERRRLLGHGQGVSERRSSDASLVDLFEQRVDERPHDTPLQDGTGRRFTYAALDAEANRLAHHLLDRGVTRGDAVGVLCRTAPALAIASLAALKAGGAVVPLTSPGHKDTLADIISAARPTVVVSERAAVHLLPDDCPLLLLETQTMQAASTIADRPRVRPSVADVACVRYEVAPDGTPTGVAIRHRGVVDDFLAPLHDGADETPSASHLILDSWSEPALALLSTLIHADTRAVAQGERHGAGLPHGTAANSGTTSLWCSAGTLAAALEEPDGLPRDLRYVFTCGTEPSVALLSRLALRFPAVRCRHWDGTADGTRSLIGVSGAPAPAQYVLDAALRPVPPGVPGELYLAARPVLGYAHRPSLT
ncbi:condensation domain-containing protein, partial [Streptomyces decoyicus]|uniref:condensation domain-containing protein n=1 Tax=Streptomyces decoyicus TaxID=249567 RepID=UPI0033A92692